jgi:hypothetical protein
MVTTPSSQPEVLTSEERWRRWEERGQESDARSMRQVRRLFWSTVVAAAVLSLLLL